MREQQHITNRRCVGEQHDQTVNANALARRRRHTMFQGTDVIGIEMHGLLICRILVLNLTAEAFGLILSVVQL